MRPGGPSLKSQQHLAFLKCFSLHNLHSPEIKARVEKYDPLQALGRVPCFQELKNQLEPKPSRVKVKEKSHGGTILRYAVFPAQPDLDLEGVFPCQSVSPTVSGPASFRKHFSMRRPGCLTVPLASTPFARVRGEGGAAQDATSEAFQYKNMERWLA